MRGGTPSETSFGVLHSFWTHEGIKHGSCLSHDLGFLPEEIDMQASFRVGLFFILLVGTWFSTPSLHASADSPRASASDAAAVDLDCVIIDDKGNTLCVKVIISGPGNQAHVAAGVCGGIDQYVSVPKNTTRKVASPCYDDDFFWLITPEVNWAQLTSCDQLSAIQLPC